MGNCCAAQKPRINESDSKKPVPRNILSNSESTAPGTIPGALQARPLIPSHSHAFSEDGGKTTGKVLDHSPIFIGDRRPNNLNPSDQIAPRDASSQVNSV